MDLKMQHAFIAVCLFDYLKTPCFIKHWKILYCIFTAEYSQQIFNFIIYGHMDCCSLLKGISQVKAFSQVFYCKCYFTHFPLPSNNVKITWRTSLGRTMECQWLQTSLIREDISDVLIWTRLTFRDIEA